MTPPRIRPLAAADWPAVEAVYAEGIEDGDATFEPSPPSWAAFDAGRLPWLRLVAEDGAGHLLGWAAASPTSARRAYAGVVEHSVYVARDARGRGVGAALLDALVDVAEACGVWSVRSGVFPENVASLALHERAGFSVVGRFERVGRLRGRWRDVVVVERRSPVVGDDTPLVRLALPGDDALVRALLASAGPPPDGLDDGLDDGFADGLDEGLDDGLDDVWRLWVADADGTGGDVVGAVGLVRRLGEDDGTHTYLLRGPVVAPAHRGTGLGGRLVRSALTVARSDAAGTPRIRLLGDGAAGWAATRA